MNRIFSIMTGLNKKNCKISQVFNDRSLYALNDTDLLYRTTTYPTGCGIIGYPTK